MLRRLIRMRREAKGQVRPQFATAVIYAAGLARVLASLVIGVEL
jgi:hypothetical protein